MIKAVFFDFDGTIIDSERFLSVAKIQAKNQLGLTISDKELLDHTTGFNRAYKLQYFKGKYGQDFPIEELDNIKVKIIHEKYKNREIPLKKGFPELFKTLKNMGLLLGLCTSTNSTTIMLALTSYGLDKTFDVMVCGDMVKVGKPNPEGYLTLANMAKVLPDECVVCEDHPQGITAGINAKMHVMAVPDTVSTPEELQKQCWAIDETFESLPQRILEFNRKEVTQN